MDSNPNSTPVFKSRAVVPRPDPLPAQNYAENPSFQDFGNDQDRGGLLEYWRILRRRKGTVIVMAFAGLLLGLLVTFPQTPVYQARTSLEIQDINNEVTNLRGQGGSTNEMGTISNALADVQTQIKILQSESLAERAVAALNAGSKKKQTRGPEATSRPSAWRQALGLPLPAPAGPEQQVRAALANLKARAAGQTRIVEVTFDSTDPQEAANFLNHLTNEFIEQNIDSRWKMMQRTGNWLTRQLDDVRIKLERSEDKLQEYARQSGLLFTGGKGGKDAPRENVAEARLSQIQTGLVTAQSERFQKQSRYEMAANASPESLPDVLNDPSLRAYQTKITELRREAAELAATYKPEYSKVKRVEAQIAPLEAALLRERSAVISRIKNEYDEAVRREKLLSNDYGTQVKLVTGDAEKTIHYNILMREVDTNRQIYDSMLQRVNESSVASAMRASNVRVIDPAKTPRAPYKPDLRTNGMLGAVAGLFLGVAFVVMRERADRTLQEPGDVTYYLNLPELGIIPSAKDIFFRPFGYFRKKPGALAVDAAPLVPPNPDAAVQTRIEGLREDRIELATWNKKSSIVAESFRTVLTSLLFTGKNGHQPRVLVMTSASPSEGKTTVVCNLAIALAEVKQNTLIIDADLRKPRVHKIFRLPNERGLTDLLTQRPLAPDALNGLLQETTIPGLTVLTAGPATHAAANLLYSPSLPELIELFKTQFEMIIIDTPPMLQMPDARVVARSADGVILVVRANSTTRDAALAARQRFSEDGTRLLGTILNDWNPKHSPNGYYGYYGGYYGGYGKYYKTST